jgi:single-strand DNA-binding protein
VNNLNSILIEGDLTCDPGGFEGSPARTVFTIGCKRSSHGPEGDILIKIIYVKVKTEGRTAENCKEYLKKGRGVRVVGTLEGVEIGLVEDEELVLPCMKGEHVEFKPQVKEVPSSTLDEVNERRGF